MTSLPSSLGFPLSDGLLLLVVLLVIRSLSGWLDRRFVVILTIETEKLETTLNRLGGADVLWLQIVVALGPFLP